MRRKLQVFVSSTFTDLKAERQAAVQAILKAGHIPAGMELFTASDKSQWDTIKRWIDESDVYMLILGGRYGSKDPATGVSYTEMEYDYARGVGKPLFSVVIEESALDAKVRDYGVSMIERDDPSSLKQFREKVLSSISAFFSDERDIKLSIHEALGDYRDDPSLKGWVSGDALDDTSALHEEISRLKDELKRATVEATQSDRKRRGKIIETEDMDEILLVLDRTSISLPEKMFGDTLKEASLKDLMRVFSDSLVTGVSSGSADGTLRFIYHNIFPKLILHNLATNSKPPGVYYYLSVLNERGKAVLSRIVRDTLQASNNDKRPQNESPG